MKYFFNRLVIIFFFIPLLFSCKGSGKGYLIPYDDSNGMWGYKDNKSGNVIIPAKYNLAYPFVNNYAIIGLSNKSENQWKFGIIDTMNNYVLQPEYSRILLVDGFIKAYKDSLVQLFDSVMNEVVSLYCTDIYPSKGQYMFVEKNDEWACYDAKNKKLTTPFEFKEIRVYEPFIVAVNPLNKTPCIYINYETGLIDEHGTTVPNTDSVYAYTDFHTDKTTVTNNKGDILFEGYYGHLGFPSYNEGLMVFCDLHKQRKWGAIDTNGKIAIPFVYDQIEFAFHSGFAVVYNDRMSGVIDKNNKLVLPYAPNTEYIIEEDSSICIYNHSIEKTRMVDNKMKEIVPYKYDRIEYIGEGYYKVKSEKLYGLIDKTGKEYLPVEYSEIWPFEDKMAAVIDTSENGGLINAKAEFVVPCKYHFERDNYNDKLFVSGFVYANKGSVNSKKVMLIDRTGKEYIVKRFPYKIFR